MKRIPPFGNIRSLLLALSLTLLGCGNGDHDHEHDHHDEHAHDDHHHAPPRGGIMIELGEHEYQVEFKMQPEVERFTMWIMDGHAESPVRIEAETVKMIIHHESPSGPADADYELAAVANENTGETVGNTSQFSIPIDRLGTLGSFKATLRSLTIRGKEFKDIKLDYDTRKVK